MINERELLDLIDESIIADYLQDKGFSVFTNLELLTFEENVKNDITSLHSCSDFQFENEAESRGYTFYNDQNLEGKIVELIRQNGDWQKLAIQYFSNLSGKIL